MTLYKWYAGTSGQAITERIRKLVSPTTPKHESDIADAIDRWVDSVRVLENMKEEFKLQDPVKITALEQLMNIGHAKLHFESLRAQYKKYDDLLSKWKEYAMKRRLEHSHKSRNDDMDLGQVDDSDRDDPAWNMGGYAEWMYPGHMWENHLDTIGATGKGKG